MSALPQHNYDDVDRALSALDHIEPPLERELWVRLLMAAHDAGVSEDDARAWSERGENFDAADFRATWRSIKPGAITKRTLFKTALDAGWSAPPDGKKLTAAERAQRDADRTKRQAAAAVQQAEDRAKAAEHAARLWNAAAPAETHPYLTRKGVKAHGLRIGKWERIDEETGEVIVTTDQALLVPMMDARRNLHSLQAIYPAQNAKKLYLKDGAKRGHFHPIGKPQKDSAGRPIFILAEGYATAASVHECTEQMTLCCFDSSNLMLVATVLRERQPEAIIIFAADNDVETKSNPGIVKALSAAIEVGGLVAVPELTGFPEKSADFNDLHAIEGANVVQRAIARAKPMAREVIVTLAPDDEAMTGAAYALRVMEPGAKFQEGGGSTIAGSSHRDFVFEQYGDDLAARAVALRERHPGARIYVLGRPGEEDAARDAAEACDGVAELLDEQEGGPVASWFEFFMAQVDAKADADPAARELTKRALGQAVGAMTAAMPPTADADDAVQAQVAVDTVARIPGVGKVAGDAAVPSTQGASAPAVKADVSAVAEDERGLVAEVGIIPLGRHGGHLVFWRRDFKRVVMLTASALGSHQGLQCLAPTQNWEAWWQQGDFKPQHASNVLINVSAGLGDVDLTRVKAEEASQDEVREAFLREKAAASGGSPAPVVLAELLAMDPRWRGVIFFDEFAGTSACSVTPPCGGSVGPLTDAHDDALAAYLSSTYGVSVSSKAAHDTANLMASQNRRHPLREYLNSLEWDGVPRLDTWLIKYAGARDDLFVRAAGAKTLIGAVERAFRPGSKVDTALVLEGPQGLKKSTLLLTLCPNVQWFAEDLAGTLGSKDSLQGLAGKWITELSEIAALDKASNKEVRSFLTRRTDHYRSPYGRRAEDHQRQCVFVGSVNPKADGTWLRDTTGGRRFWPVTATITDVAGLEQERDQLWAEAVHRWRNHEPHWLNDAEEAVAKGEQKARLEQNPWEHTVDQFLVEHDGVSPVATAEIFEFSQHRKPASRDSGELVHIAEALSARGWQNRKHGAARVMRWFPPRPL